MAYSSYSSQTVGWNRNFWPKMAIFNFSKKQKSLLNYYTSLKLWFLFQPNTVNEVFGWNRNRYAFIVPIPAKHPGYIRFLPPCCTHPCCAHGRENEREREREREKEKKREREKKKKIEREGFKGSTIKGLLNLASYVLENGHFPADFRFQ